MYLITVEGGDGSGKGLATQMIAEILHQEFTFSGIDVTAEPRRDAELGFTVEAVEPVKRACGLIYFAADRMDHSHTWIDLLSRGMQWLVNAMSFSLYQG